MVWCSQQCYWWIIKRIVVYKKRLFMWIFCSCPLSILGLLVSPWVTVVLRPVWGTYNEILKNIIAKGENTERRNPLLSRKYKQITNFTKISEKMTTAVFQSKSVSFILALLLVVTKLEGFWLPSDGNHFGTGPVLTSFWLKLSHSKQIMDFACFIS